ncbi:hypothetical protein M0805_001293 [Coniferiporia weirii]|nr:hypothetical protein M0805_001293 [Coniferiporia weirii]
MARKAKTTSKELENEKVTTRGARRVSAKNPRKNESTGKPKRGKADSVESDGGDGDGLSDAYKSEIEGEESDLVLLDSDGLDDSDFETSAKGGQKRKRGFGNTKASPKKKAGSAVSSPKKAKGNTVKKRKKPSSDDEEEEELEDGLEIVGTVVEAPKTGRVPPGQISQNTFNFLRQLQDPKYNDRIWFKLHEPVFRQAEKEWKDFIDVFTLLLTETDPQIPVLPPNDVSHRIYRDVRFSNDKTPYKSNFSASFSRSGRKGIFAACVC